MFGHLYIHTYFTFLCYKIHAVSYFLLGIICGPIWGSFVVRDHLRFNLGIICGPGSFAVPRSFAEPYRTPSTSIHGRSSISQQRSIYFDIHGFMLHSNLLKCRKGVFLTFPSAKSELQRLLTTIGMRAHRTHKCRGLSTRD